MAGAGTDKNDMIQANELRIGNYINANLSNGEVEFDISDGKITGIIDDGVYLNGIKFEYRHLVAIPLTEEWLLKAGIQCRDDNPKSKSNYEGDLLFDLLGHEFSNSVISTNIENRGFYSYSLNDGKVIYSYVHQLQNLYHALTGSELIFIKL